MTWFNNEEKSKGVIEALNNFRSQVITFNKVAGKEYDSEFQQSLCLEEAKELIDEYEKDKVAFTKECCDLFIVGCLHPNFDINVVYAYYSLESFVSIIIKYTTDEEDAVILSTSIFVALQNDYKVNWQGAMQEVLDSNMSKFSVYSSNCEYEYDKHCQTLMESGRYTGVYWSKVGDYVVWKDDNEKVLRGLDYFKADVGRFVP